MKLLTIDPSTKKVGFAIFDNGELKDYGYLKTDLKELTAKIAELGEHILAIEQQYQSFNTKTLMSLVEVRTVIETLSVLYGGKGIYRIPPSTWQSNLFKMKGKVKRAERKALSKKYASKYIGKDCKKDDIADAICIGLYVLDNKNITKYFHEEVLV